MGFNSGFKGLIRVHADFAKGDAVGGERILGWGWRGRRDM